eukprot:scaffold68065_cov57-Phaeocystis_antarctica.AAC.3
MGNKGVVPVRKRRQLAICAHEGVSVVGLAPRGAAAEVCLLDLLATILVPALTSSAELYHPALRCAAVSQR